MIAQVDGGGCPVSRERHVNLVDASLRVIVIYRDVCCCYAPNGWCAAVLGLRQRRVRRQRDSMLEVVPVREVRELRCAWGRAVRFGPR